LAQEARFAMTVTILLLLVVGFALVMAEAHLAAFGLLGAAGIAAIAGGIVLAMVDAGGSVVLALALTVPPALVVATFGVLAMRKALAGSHRRARCGAEALIGEVGIVRRPLDPLGQVAVDGELWRARRSWADEEEDPPPSEGEPVVVDRVQGLTLSVRRAEVWEVER
jgi:membrane-bound serine protease (ClpP class)